MKKVLMSCAAVSVLFLMVAIASAGDKSATVNGYVSDSMCGAKGANASHAACMTKCLGKGAKALIVTDSDQKVGDQIIQENNARHRQLGPVELKHRDNTPVAESTVSPEKVSPETPKSDAPSPVSKLTVSQPPQ